MNHSCCLSPAPCSFLNRLSLPESMLSNGYFISLFSPLPSVCHLTNFHSRVETVKETEENRFGNLVVNPF